MLMDQARQSRQQPRLLQPKPAEGGGFEKPDWRQFTPPDQADAVERIIAAGAKLMYSPEMRDELQAAVQTEAPTAQKLAENTVGLLLTLDQKASGGLPIAAMFPAAMGLLGEAAAVLEAAGQQVTQEDWNDAAMQMYVLIGRKLGASDEQIMQGAQAALPPEGGAPAPDAAPAPEGGQPPVSPEEQGMQEGMA